MIAPPGVTGEGLLSPDHPFGRKAWMFSDSQRGGDGEREPVQPDRDGEGEQTRAVPLPVLAVREVAGPASGGDHDAPPWNAPA